MAMESVATDLHGVTRPNSDPELEQLKSELEPKLKDPWDNIMLSSWQRQILEESDTTVLHGATRPYSKPEPYFKPSPYDYVPPPGLLGGGIRPHAINEKYRPFLEDLSRLALEYYNNKNKEGSGESFEFVGLVKCNFWDDLCPNALVGYVATKPTEFYITFEAKSKAKGDPPNSPAITIFQAKLLKDVVDKDKPHVVEECRIKT